MLQIWFYQSWSNLNDSTCSVVFCLGLSSRLDLLRQHNQDSDALINRRLNLLWPKAFLKTVVQLHSLSWLRSCPRTLSPSYSPKGIPVSSTPSIRIVTINTFINNNISNLRSLNNLPVLIRFFIQRLISQLIPNLMFVPINLINA